MTTIWTCMETKSYTLRLLIWLALSDSASSSDSFAFFCNRHDKVGTNRKSFKEVKDLIMLVKYISTTQS